MTIKITFQDHQSTKFENAKVEYLKGGIKITHRNSKYEIVDFVSYASLYMSTTYDELTQAAIENVAAKGEK